MPHPAGGPARTAPLAQGIGAVPALRRTPGRLTFHVDGHRLRADADEVDAPRFERLVADGAPREALALWHGHPYQGLDVPLLTDEATRLTNEATRLTNEATRLTNEATRLTERRLAAEEDRHAAELAAGRAASVVGDLAELVRAHPPRERTHLLHC